MEKRERENFSEKPDSGVTRVIDDEGNKVSPLELMHYIPPEDEEMVKDEILQTLNLLKTEYGILAPKSGGLNKLGFLAS